MACGWVSYVSCPGCTPSVPADSTCACAVNQDDCDCVTQSGGIQNGTIVECNTGYFSYIEDWEGYRITKTGTEWCMR